MTLLSLRRSSRSAACFSVLVLTAVCCQSTEDAPLAVQNPPSGERAADSPPPVSSDRPGEEAQQTATEHADESPLEPSGVEIGGFEVVATTFNPSGDLPEGLPKYAVTHDPRFVILLRVDEVLAGQSPFVPGQELVLIIHSPALMFGGYGFSGHQFAYKFAILRQEDGSTSYALVGLDTWSRSRRQAQHAAAGRATDPPADVGWDRRESTCTTGLHAPRTGPFAVMLFCEDALGAYASIVYTEPMGASVSPMSTEWSLDNRYWYDPRWGADVTGFSWSPDGEELLVSTSDGYGSGGLFEISLAERRVKQLLPAGSAVSVDSPGPGYVITDLLSLTDPLAELAASHIEANVPAPDDFDRFLRRDLEAHFGSDAGLSPVSVDYELLRDGPTQAGIAYPKFYAWVQIRENGQLRREGAVRLAAIDRQRFEITHFASKDDIRLSPAEINQIFPAPVCDRIRAKIDLDSRSDVPPPNDD